jgi:DNA (cytosine-5)-methyltransferase 1
VEDAEELQGFERGWTDVDFETPRRNGPRWKLVGNAVTARVSEWVARRIAEPGDPEREYTSWEHTGRSWPTAAWGESGKTWIVPGLSEFPEQQPYTHLLDVVDVTAGDPVTLRGAAGFWSRLQPGNLGRHPGFRDDVAAYVDYMRSGSHLAAAG